MAVPSSTNPIFEEVTLTGGVKVMSGTGAPTFVAPANTLYLRKDGSSTVTRLYVNTTGSTTWATVTTSA